MKYPWNFPDNSFLSCGCLYEKTVSENVMGNVYKSSGAAKPGAILIFNVFGRNRDTDVENELVGTGGEEEGETK